MARHHLIPGAVILGVAFILSILISISVPYVRAFDLVRTSYGTPRTIGTSNDQATEFRWGIWGVCASLANSGGDWQCVSRGYGYDSSVGGQDVGASWTRGTVIHPIAAAAIFIAWLLSFSEHLTVLLVASLVAFLGSLLTLIVFAIDIALFVRIKNQMGNIDGSTSPGPAFWMTLVVLILTAVAGCIVCFGRRRHKAKTEPYTIETKRPWYHKFRRNRV
ncbi:hypothetical protein M408DRAFT_76759 [Serendipita vermifera MAFF 305830]|uniref:Pali-domain-containing protein n=1 Tax=Serendipita vermifera MAFF 305830 TaxID=933852 RepID=A0A0C3AX91_SERVB|nr:hypothetical protein M408DRAFT_76759 [Serendipita vermifera MAFF 305830]